MSWQKSVLNTWLRWTERPFLARASEPSTLRRALELKAKMFFHAPRGTQKEWIDLGSSTENALKITGPWTDSSRVILYFHGGGFVFGSPKTHAAMLAQLAKRIGGAAILPTYPLAPEHQFPAALDTAFAAYEAVLALGHAPENIVMGGDSAGGGLVLSLLAKLLQSEMPLPAAVFAFSPLTDLTYSGASVAVNARADVVLPAERVFETAQMYLGHQDPLNPLVSPLYADFHGAPPVWLCVGDTEILLDDTRRIAPRMKCHGVEVQMHVERDRPHVWPLFHNLMPEAGATLDQLAEYIKARPKCPAP